MKNLCELFGDVIYPRISSQGLYIGLGRHRSGNLNTRPAALNLSARRTLLGPKLAASASWGASWPAGMLGIVRARFQKREFCGLRFHTRALSVRPRLSSIGPFPTRIRLDRHIAGRSEHHRAIGGGVVEGVEAERVAHLVEGERA